MKKKTLTVAIALVLVVALAVGATWALLTHTAGPVTNTFVVGKLTDAKDALTLKEHTVKQNPDGSYVLDETTYANGEVEYGAIVPGTTIAKDPTVTVKNLTGDAYLYIVVKDTVDTATLTHSVDSTKWIKIGENAANNTTLYKYAGGIVNATNAADPLNVPVLTNSELRAADSLTQGTNLGEITVNAYLVQAAGSATAADAWNNSGFNGTDATGITAVEPTTGA